MFESKTESTVRRLRERIAAGELGACGDRFMTTRELAAREKLSLKTAFRVIGSLRDSGLLEKSGRGHRIAPVLPETGAAARPLLIGFLAACLENPYFAKLAAYAEEFAHSVGASMIIASSSYDFATECERLRMFCRQGVAGILVCPRASTPREEAFYANLPVPCVMLGRRLESAECDAVLVDNQLAAQRVARHLIEEGITEFAYIGQSGKLNDRRLFGFRAELAAANFALPESRVLFLDGQRPEACRAAIAQLLEKRGPGRLGVFCYHDLFAIRCLNLCLRMGIRVPDEVAVAGFDDLPGAAETYPPLTSVSYPVRDMVRLAFESLYTRIKFHTSTGICRYLDSKLIVRGSTTMNGHATSTT